MMQRVNPHIQTNFAPINRADIACNEGMLSLLDNRPATTHFTT
ncbi:protein of unknown function [Paraburkholderia dioscoreae]|uniref:Uncharacterized protein n=1 Tax=Paraburkholderia dioscoreae TaxID=2604047 RepID=A0A5Q4ZCP1_9BURK|nr:protein of unknown function [Paraburkholderia dioscoreae]